MPQHPVFIKQGDALHELEELLRVLGGAGPAGLHRQMYVTRADQTVVMTAGLDSPLALALRGREGWAEPTDT